MRKFVFIKWLAAKVRLCFFKNTIQLQDQGQLCFKRYLFNVEIFEMSWMQLPEFPFEIGFLLFLSIYAL